jgi:hypothetical protein
MADTTEPIDIIDYYTKAGDTFDTIALELYAEERKAHLIMEYNRDLIPVLIFDAGVHLRLPIYADGEDPDTLPPWRSGHADGHIQRRGHHVEGGDHRLHARDVRRRKERQAPHIFR